MATVHPINLGFHSLIIMITIMIKICYAWVSKPFFEGITFFNLATFRS